VPLITQVESNIGYNAGPFVGPPLPAVTNSTVALLLGGANLPVLPNFYVVKIMNAYVAPHFPGATTVALYTPEQFWPLTPGLGNLTLGQSIAQGVPLLDAAIKTELAQGNTVALWGTSEGSVVLTHEIRNLMAAGSPSADRLSFMLTGNPNNPNGGLLERLPGLYVPVVDVLFNGATPANSPYPTMIFSNQYDGVANFPQYPLNAVSDLNALAGFLFGTHDYGDFTAGQVANYIQLPTSPGYAGNTTYYEMLSQNLPLVTPLRELGTPPYGNALADLLQPDLRVLVDMGYGSGEYADIPTPASLFELPNPFTIAPDLAHGTIQGVEASLVDLGLMPPSYYPMGQYPFSAVLDPNLNFPLPQFGTTGVSLLTGAEGRLMTLLGLVPSWEQ
jgi:PE-PPE domain